MVTHNYLITSADDRDNEILKQITTGAQKGSTFFLIISTKYNVYKAILDYRIIGVSNDTV